MDEKVKELRNAGLATQERIGRNLIYRADFAQMNGVLGYLTNNCGEGADCDLKPEAYCPANNQAC